MTCTRKSISKTVYWLTLLALGFAVSTANGQLEFHYKFDVDGEAPLVDATGNNEDLRALTNGEDHRYGEDPLVDDGFSIGLNAPGDGHPTGSFLLLPNAPQPESFSFSLWIKPQLTGAAQGILARDTVWWPSPCNFYCLYIDPQQSLVWKTAGIEAILSEEAIIEEEETYHIAVTYLDSDGADTGKADRTRLYVNGELVEEADRPEEIPSPESIADANGIYNSIWFGTLSSFGGYWGEMDDLQLYSTELTADDVAFLNANPGSVIGGNNAPGDFNGDGALDLMDINALSEASAAGQNDASFDLNDDQLVDGTDLQSWVELANTWIGDANLDGEFNSSDLVRVFESGKFETGQTANWAEGDWTGDGKFDSSDFVTAFQSGGFELGPKAASSVPEPTGIQLVLLGLVGLMAARRRR